MDDDDGPERVAEDLADESYPNLASVPDGPRRSTSQKDRNKTVRSLKSDLESATFVDPAAGGGLQANRSLADRLRDPGRLAAVIYFQPGSLNLDSRDELVLRGAAALQKEQGGRLLVVGHAAGGEGDAGVGAKTSIQNKANALRLSLERANQVAAALIAWGVDPKAIEIEALADSRPVYYETDTNGAAGNRRAEIFLES